jgi:hypothetical protein
MQTSELIERLSGQLRPTPRRTQLLGIAIALGGAGALVLLLTLLGWRPDLAGALLTGAFWMKWTFVLVTAAVAFVLCARLGRPESKPGWWPVALLVPVVILGAVACVQMSLAPAIERRMMWLGHSAIECPWCIALLSVPLLIGILWAFRFFAPTRLRLAGFSAGLLAGATAAVIYALSCDESTAAFVATWYSAGMLIPALVGLAIGPRVLRW